MGIWFIPIHKLIWLLFYTGTSSDTYTNPVKVRFFKDRTWKNRFHPNQSTALLKHIERYLDKKFHALISISLLDCEIGTVFWSTLLWHRGSFCIFSRHTGGWVNLNFLVPPYGVAFLNPWNTPNKIWASLNSKIKFEIHSINW